MAQLSAGEAQAFSLEHFKASCLRVQTWPRLIGSVITGHLEHKIYGHHGSLCEDGAGQLQRTPAKQTWPQAAQVGGSVARKQRGFGLLLDVMESHHPVYAVSKCVSCF